MCVCVPTTSSRPALPKPPRLPRPDRPPAPRRGTPGCCKSARRPPIAKKEILSHTLIYNSFLQNIVIFHRLPFVRKHLACSQVFVLYPFHDSGLDCPEKKYQLTHFKSPKDTYFARKWLNDGLISESFGKPNPRMSATVSKGRMVTRSGKDA